MTTAADVFASCAELLQDTTFRDRYPDSKLLKWLNEAETAIIDARPDALTRHDTITLVAGTLQSIPADSIMLVDVIRNLPQGRACTATKRGHLDSFQPNWHNELPEDEVVEWAYDPQRDRPRFYVNPPSTGGARQLELVTSYVPTKLTLASAAIHLHDVYVPILVDYVCYRSFMDGTEVDKSIGKANAYLQSFGQRLGLQTQARTAIDPAAPAKREG